MTCLVSFTMLVSTSDVNDLLIYLTEDMPLASNDIDVQLLDSAKSGDLETVKVCTTCLHVYILWIICLYFI